MHLNIIIMFHDRTIGNRREGRMSFTVTSGIAYVEHVVLSFTMEFVGVTQDDIYTFTNNYESGEAIYWPERGNVIVSLTSPSGTTSTLLPRRSADIYPDSYDAWPFMSVHFWGENPSGTWTITVRFVDTVGSIRVSVPEVMIYGVASTLIPNSTASSIPAPVTSSMMLDHPLTSSSPTTAGLSLTSSSPTTAGLSPTVSHNTSSSASPNSSSLNTFNIFVLALFSMLYITVQL